VYRHYEYEGAMISFALNLGIVELEGGVDLCPWRWGRPGGHIVTSEKYRPYLLIMYGFFGPFWGEFNLLSPVYWWRNFSFKDPYEGQYDDE